MIRQFRNMCLKKRYILHYCACDAGDLSDDSNDDDKDESESENSKDGSSSEEEDANAAKNNQGVKQDGTLNMLKNVIEKGEFPISLIF